MHVGYGLGRLASDCEAGCACSTQLEPPALIDTKARSKLWHRTPISGLCACVCVDMSKAELSCSPNVGTVVRLSSTWSSSGVEH